MENLAGTAPLCFFSNFFHLAARESTNPRALLLLLVCGL